MQNLLYTLVGYGRIIAAFGLLVLGAYVLAAGRLNVGLSEDVRGLPARLMGLGITVMGFVLLVVLPVLY